MRSIKILFSLLAVVMLPVTSVNAKTLLTVEEMREIKGKGCEPCGKYMSTCDDSCRNYYNPSEGWYSYHCDDDSMSVGAYCSEEGVEDNYCDTEGTHYCSNKMIHGGFECPSTGSDAGENCNHAKALKFEDCPGQ